MFLVAQNWQVWYEALSKPAWTPSGGTIGLIWSILYPIILVSYVYAIYAWRHGKLPIKLAIIFSLNVLANLIFTPIQFGLENLWLSSLDILIVWSTIVLFAIGVWRYSKILAIAQIPYFVWVTIATILQLTITFSNL
ncbi:MAG: tryptophan-rich sensory protein [Candidatus Vogelbacteria bacterium]|nr:tryptophan-rich sensory protein [Candidatus Vogelbacteria bacterium]